MDTTSLEKQVGQLLRARGLYLVLAESCTGGLVGHWVTNVPGSSEYYLGSVTAYAYEAKRRLLGVEQSLLDRYGAVSRECVIAMARGVRASLAGEFPVDSILGVSISGIAGPGGGMPEKPVGTVWVGMSAADGDWAWKFLWPGDRLQNKEDSARAALRLILDYLQGSLPTETSA